jgi:hypothetical protein
LTVPALIPGATYRIITHRNKQFVLSKEFQPISGKTVGLGDITVERRE